MGKIFVRERTSVGKGAGRPRFAVVATTGIDLKVYHTHMRREEMQKIAEELEAELVYLPRGDKEGENVRHGGRGKRGKRKGAEQD